MGWVSAITKPALRGALEMQESGMKIARKGYKTKVPASEHSTLNIGLKVGDEVGLTPAQVIKAVKARGGKVLEHRIVDSDSQPTVIIQLERPMPGDRLAALSDELGQDAIAQRFSDGTGELQGPRTENWGGEFLPEYFIGIDDKPAVPELRADQANAAPLERGPIKSGKQPAGVVRIDTPENRARILELVQRGREVGGDRWYWTEGLRNKFHEVLGPEEGETAFKRFMDLNAATSPRSTVEAEIKRAGILYQNDRAGNLRPLAKEEWPKGTGHLANETQMHAIRRMAEEGSLGSPDQQMKITAYADNLAGNLDPVTVDTHNWQIWSGQKKSPTDNEYRAMEKLQAEMAAELGMSPAEFQSALWVGGAELTGVADPRNFTAQLNERVANTARTLGKTEDEALAGFIRGDNRLYQMATPVVGAGVLGAGALAAPEAEAGALGAAGRAFGRAGKFVSSIENTAGEVRRGGVDVATAARRIENDLERIQRLGAIAPEERAAALDAGWATYADLQNLGNEVGGAGRQRVFTRRQTDIPPGVATDDLGGRGISDDVGGLMRLDRPLTAEEMADLTAQERLAREMTEVPSVYQGYFGETGSTGRFFNDPFNDFSDPTGGGKRSLPEWQGDYPGMDLPPQYVPQTEWGPSWFEGQGITQSPSGASTLGFEPDLGYGQPQMFPSSRWESKPGVDDPSFAVSMPRDTMEIMRRQLDQGVLEMNDPWSVSEARVRTRTADMVVRDRAEAETALRGALEELEEKAATAKGGAKRKLNRQIQKTQAALDDVTNPEYGTDHPQKRMFAVGGALGLGATLDEAEGAVADPGVLADPSIEDRGGRVQPRGVSVPPESEWPDNSTWESISGIRPGRSPANRINDALLDVPGFLYGVAKEVGGLMNAGSYAIGEMASGVLFGDPKTLDEIQVGMDSLREQWGGVDEGNKVMQELTNMVTNSPAARDAVGGAMRAYGIGRDFMERNYGREGAVFYDATMGTLGEVL